ARNIRGLGTRADPLLVPQNFAMTREFGLGYGDGALADARLPPGIRTEDVVLRVDRRHRDNNQECENRVPAHVHGILQPIVTAPDAGTNAYQYSTQNVATGFNGDPVPPPTVNGAAVIRNSQRCSRLAASLSASRSQLSKIGMPIAISTS